MIVVASKPGQLGNLLFVYAHLIGRAIESNLKVANAAFDDYAHLFPATANDLLCRFPARQSRIRCTRWRRRVIFHLFHFTTRLLPKLRLKLPFLRVITIKDYHTQLNLGDPQFLESLKPGQLVLLRGWGFRDCEALLKHADAVREFFRPHDRQLQNIAALIERARQDTDILVGVHIRHGILYFANARHYFYTTKRYAEIMDEVVDLFPKKRVGFLICSDWPQDPELFSRFRVTFGTHDLIEDLYAFARCDYLIGAQSTFTVWASFYGNVPLSVISGDDRRQSMKDFQVRVLQD
jgi:hypothetical protein